MYLKSSSQNGNAALSVNGEIYNHEELERDLKRENPELAAEWSTDSDCEVLLHLFKKYGPRDELYRNRSSRKTYSQLEKRSSGSPILLKIISENQFSGKTYFYTIASSFLERNEVNGMYAFIAFNQETDEYMVARD